MRLREITQARVWPSLRDYAINISPMQLVGGAGHQRGVAVTMHVNKLWYVLKLLYSEETNASITGKATCDPNHHEKRSRGYFTVAYSPSERCCFTVR